MKTFCLFSCSYFFWVVRIFPERTFVVSAHARLVPYALTVTQDVGLGRGELARL
jgi:hypothetical protein